MNARLRPWQAANARFQDADYEAVGVTIAKDAASLYAACDIILKVRAPIDAEIPHLKKGQTLICWASPAQNEELLEKVKSVAQTSLRWIWCHVLAAHKKWMFCHQWPISLVTVP